MRSELHLVYPTTSESEELMLDDLSEFLDRFDLDSTCRQHLTLCLSEAFTNALKHGNKWDQSKRVYLNISINDNDIVADITDQGKGGLAAISRRPRPKILAESGRGIDFIYRYCPGAQFKEVESGGLQVTVQMPRRMNLQRSTTDLYRR